MQINNLIKQARFLLAVILVSLLILPTVIAQLPTSYIPLPDGNEIIMVKF